MTTQEKPQATKVTLGAAKGKLVRFSYLHIEKPHKNAQSGRHEFSVQLRIPKENVEDYAAIKAAVDEQTKLFFPKGKIPPKFHNPIKDGDTDVNQKGEPLDVPGHWLVAAKTDAFKRTADGKSEDLSQPEVPPGMVGATRGADGKLEKTTAKSGDYGRVSVNVKGYTTGDSGVGVYLNNLQKVQTGEPLGKGRKDAADEFGDFEDDEVDPLG